jgi:molybdopterin synthase catalytic subunit
MRWRLFPRWAEDEVIAITTLPIELAAVEAAVVRPEAGAILIFSGVTRNNFDRRTVTGLRYEAYEPMAIMEMESIRDEVLARWPGARVAMVHRIGPVDVGETSVVIAVSTPHRDACYAASRFAIDTLKERVPIWKKEQYADGPDAWKENQPS